jgi:hypothetical protein
VEPPNDRDLGEDGLPIDSFRVSGDGD